MPISEKELYELFRTNPGIASDFLIRASLKGAVTLTDLVSPSLSNSSLNQNHAPEKIIDVEDWIDDWRRLWKDVLGPNHSHLLLSKGPAGVHGRCKKLMTEFCKRYAFTREEIFAATTQWLNDLKTMGNNGRIAKNPEGFLAPHDKSSISKKDFESGELYDYLVNRKASTEIEDDFNTSYLDL